MSNLITKLRHDMCKNCGLKLVYHPHVGWCHVFDDKADQNTGETCPRAEPEPLIIGATSVPKPN